MLNLYRFISSCILISQKLLRGLPAVPYILFLRLLTSVMLFLVQPVRVPTELVRSLETIRYVEQANLQHQRDVSWTDNYISRDEMSESLRNSAGSIGTVSNLTSHASELDGLIGGYSVTPITSTDETIEDPTYFALEKHLEDFLVANWDRTSLGQKYNIFSEEGDSGTAIPK